MQNAQLPHASTPPIIQPKVVRTIPASRIALVGGFKPTKCGLATFTTDVFEQMCRWMPDHQIDVYAVTPSVKSPVSSEATATIYQHDLNSYKAAAARINETGVDAVWIQHEFGIYGGPAGSMILELVAAVAAPVIITLHTVLEAPSPEQRFIIDQMRIRATGFVVMSRFGRDILVSVYGVPSSRIQVIEHGAPDRAKIPASEARSSLGLPERPTIMTFGLLGPGKGLETAIRAMPAILDRHSDVVYRIVGATHPNLVAAEGETYRDGLKALAADLGVAHAIEWVEEFLETDQLLQQLASCDIYLTPYVNLGQSTSGTLAYAVALGCAVVSTPYIHARELLSDNAGVLVAPNSADSISMAINDLFSEPSRLEGLRSTAYERGRQTIWKEFVARSASIIDAVVPASKIQRASTAPAQPSTAAFMALVDDVGILQHSIGVVPDRHHGYCIDDNARALILVNEYGRDLAHLAPRFASFLQHGWNEDVGRFRNFMGYDRRWLEAIGSEDSNGRTVWALGHTALSATDPKLRQWAVALFDRTVPRLSSITSPRAMAFLVLGAEKMLMRENSNVAAKNIVDQCARRFSELPLEGRPDWPWFEDSLSYDNGRIPQALFALAAMTGDIRFAKAATAQLTWLCSISTTAKGFFRPVGSEGFGLERACRPFDQQPLEAWAMIDACSAAMTFVPSANWHTMATRAYNWYLQRNDRHMPLADPTTGSCCDGLMAQGLNANTGAESVLSFSLAYQALMKFGGAHQLSAATIINARVRKSH